MKKHLLIMALFCSLCMHAMAQTVPFNFDNSPVYSPFPISVTSGGYTAHLSATGAGYSIQNSGTTGNYTPVGFTGNYIYPSSVFASDLLIGFDQPLTSFAILYAPQELACDSSARMRVTAYSNNVLVGTNTCVADPPGTWPSATLTFGSATAFDRVVVHYDAPPPTGGDYGPIFMADNMVVTFATPVPEPAGMLLLIFTCAGLFVATIYRGYL